MRYIAIFVLSLIFWLLITFNFSVSNIITGSVASMICSFIFAKYYFHGVHKFLQPHRYYWFLIYLFFFTLACIKANFDVAYRVLHPAMPIRPGIVRVKTILTSKFAITLLANSITMTPGTITVDVIDNDLYVHWIYVRTENPDLYTKIITGRFEKIIKNMAE
jgi:multicomponent Na+:H+ antiporter subunit E